LELTHSNLVCAPPDAPTASTAAHRGAAAIAFRVAFAPVSGPAESSNEFTDIDAKCCCTCGGRWFHDGGGRALRPPVGEHPLRVPDCESMTFRNIP
jgi:hypothetical protein